MVLVWVEERTLRVTLGVLVITHKGTVHLVLNIAEYSNRKLPHFLS
jgi:hypothetical protein